MNRLIIYIVFAQACLCIIIAVVGSVWYKENNAQNNYLPFDWSVTTDGVITYFSYYLLLNTMLPISLIITLEIVKVCQAFFIMNDVLIYSQERDRKAKVSSTSIIEELG